MSVGTKATAGDAAASPAVRPVTLGHGWLAAGIIAVAAAVVLGAAVGPVALAPDEVVAALLDRLPGVTLPTALGERDAAILFELRLPRVVLGLLVGAMLSLCGASYQGVFRNPLVDPYLLGAAAGAGLGVTVGITAGLPSTSGLVPLAAFGGALVAVAMTYALGASGGSRATPIALVLAGVAVTSFLTALQTFVQQRHQDTIRQIYSWILGRLATAGWDEVWLVLPYALGSAAVLLAHRRTLDVLAVGDDEANALGLHARRSRLVIVAAASLGTAAAVSVSGLIGFVGIIVPHTVRLLAGSSYRVILPLAVLLGGAFLALADLLARLALAPAEIPIGVVTAFFGAPFFLVVLRSARKAGA